MVRILEAAANGGFYDTVLWIGAILLKANSDPSSKEDFSKYIKLKNAYMKVGRVTEANEAMKYAVKMRPDDADLAREARDIAATDAMKRGGYDKGGSFRDSVKDMGKQKELMDKDTDVRTMDVLALQINAAESEWKAEPNEPGKLMKYVDLLAKTEQPEYENRAIELLENAFETTHQFRWREASGRITMAQLTRTERAKRMDIAAHPTDEAKKKDYQDFVRERALKELAIFKEGVENYPTDMNKRYQLGYRMFQLGQFDECIPVFQQARNDPKFKVAATVALGQAFLESGFVEEAVDTLKDLIEGYEIKNDAKYTEMSYWYGRALEKKGDIPAALKAYSGVAMANFNYRDVQGRIKRLRSNNNPPPPTSGT
jgi:tetratricopeptide (TPR) repeat protein